MMFTLHPRLQADTIFLTETSLFDIRLMNDSRFVWVMIIPRKENCTQVTDLSVDDYLELSRLTHSIAHTLKTEFKADRMNVGILGNLVPQLHCHVIVRYETDEVWPAPVWGNGQTVPYTDEQKEQIVQHLKTLLNSIIN